MDLEMNSFINERLVELQENLENYLKLADKSDVNTNENAAFQDLSALIRTFLASGSFIDTATLANEILLGGPNKRVWKYWLALIGSLKLEEKKKKKVTRIVLKIFNQNILKDEKEEKIRVCAIAALEKVLKEEKEDFTQPKFQKAFVEFFKGQEELPVEKEPVTLPTTKIEIKPEKFQVDKPIGTKGKIVIKGSLDLNPEHNKITLADIPDYGLKVEALDTSFDLLKGEIEATVFKATEEFQPFADSKYFSSLRVGVEVSALNLGKDVKLSDIDFTPLVVKVFGKVNLPLEVYKSLGIEALFNYVNIEIEVAGEYEPLSLELDKKILKSIAADYDKIIKEYEDLGKLEEKKKKAQKAARKARKAVRQARKPDIIAKAKESLAKKEETLKKVRRELIDKAKSSANKIKVLTEGIEEKASKLSKFGKKVIPLLKKQFAKRLASVLFKFIPIVNVISLIMDGYEVYKFAKGMYDSYSAEAAVPVDIEERVRTFFEEIEKETVLEHMNQAYADNYAEFFDKFSKEEFEAFIKSYIEENKVTVELDFEVFLQTLKDLRVKIYGEDLPTESDVAVLDGAIEFKDPQPSTYYSDAKYTIKGRRPRAVGDVVMVDFYHKDGAKIDSLPNDKLLPLEVVEVLDEDNLTLGFETSEHLVVKSDDGVKHRLKSFATFNYTISTASLTLN